MKRLLSTCGCAPLCPLPHAPQDSPETGTKAEVAALLAELLQQKAGLLREYFGIEVDAGECIY